MSSWSRVIIRAALVLQIRSIFKDRHRLGVSYSRIEIREHVTAYRELIGGAL